MHIGLKIGVGVGAATIVGGGIALALRAGHDENEKIADPAAPGAGPVRGLAPGGGTSPGDEPIDPATDYPPFDERFPEGGGTSPGDEPLRMPVRGTIDPPGFWNEGTIDGDLRGTRLDARIDPPGWGSADVELSGRVDYGGFSTKVDPWGWGNDTAVSGTRSGNGFRGTVDRPGIWNDVNHVIEETVRGAQVTRHGRFDEALTPGFSEASWTSTPVGTGGGARILEFDPPGWGNTTRVTLEGNLPAGVEATVAAHLFNEWKLEQERLDDYPNTGNGGTSPGDDGSYPGSGYPGDTSPGDDGSGYPGNGGYPGSGGGYPGSGGYPDPSYPGSGGYPGTSSGDGY
ncbi:MAG: hypothetical protein JWM86_1523 [Thermoleophilia bacterium]|nr:hypothetical protein [Thermoleophilia bacterium]